MNENGFPTIQADCIPRKNLDEQLDDAMARYRMVYITGQTGWGKTTSTVLWLRKSHRQFCWVDLREETDPLEWLAREEWELAEEGILILDSFEALSIGKRDSVCRALLASRHSSIVISRTSLPTLLEAERGRKVGVITPAELGFSRAEILELLDSADIAEKRTSILHVMEKTLSWPLACYYLIDTIREQGRNYDDDIYALTTERIYRYFDKHIFDCWTLEQQRFMLVVGSFLSLTLLQMRQLTGCTQSERVVRELLDAGSFYHETAPHTYEIIPFFRNYLEDRQRKLVDPQHLRRIYRNAGHMFESDRQYGLAMECYLRCGDLDSLAFVLEQFSMQGPGTGEIWQHRRFFWAMPEETVSASPQLCYAMCLLEEIAFHLERVDFWESCLQKMGESFSKSDPRKREAQDLLISLRMALPHRQGTVNLSTMRRIAKRVLSGECNVGRLALTANRPSVYNGGLDFSRYADVMPLATKLFEPVPEIICGVEGVGAVSLVRAEWLYDQDKLSEALVQVVSTLPRIERSRAVENYFAAVYLQSRIILADGQDATTRTMLMNLRDRLVENHATHLLPNMDAALALLALYTNDREKLEIWMESGAPDESEEICTLDRFRYSVKARGYLAQGRTMEAIALLTRMEAIQKAFSRDIEICENRFLLALCWDRQQNRQASMECMEECLRIARKRHLPRILMDEGMQAYQILKEYLKDHPTDRFLQTVLQGSKKMGLNHLEYLKPAAMGVGQLTDAEREVLLLLAGDYTNAEICDLLAISINTVKTHTKKIFFKLDVRNRAQAVKVARELKLIP